MRKTKYRFHFPHIPRARASFLKHTMPSRKRKSELQDHPLGNLSREDLNIIMELVLLSGSLKDLAAAYRVTYPTMRRRIDKLIERVRVAKAGTREGPLDALLSQLVQRNEITASGARSVQEAARAALM